MVTMDADLILKQSCHNKARLSRITYRKLIKRERRRSRRQESAKIRSQEESAALALLSKDPVYVTRLADQAALDLCRQTEERRISEENHKLWLEREQVAQFEFQKTLKIQQEAEKRAQEQRHKIRREFEEIEAKRKLQKEQKQKAEEEILRNHRIKLQQIRDYIEGVSTDVPDSLLGTIETNPLALQECQYFKKTSVCRFGDRCSRKHIKTKLSCILLIPNFFRTENFLKGYSITNANEIIENCLEVNREYNEFFEDICQEFEKYGTIINLLVCTNSEQHMTGNVLVEYETSKSALAACYSMNGRFYGGIKLAMEFCHNLNWRTAVCGLSLNNKCSRGNSCNYLHVFRNPGNRYPLTMNTRTTFTPSPAVNSLNNTNTVDRTKDINIWNEPEKDCPQRKHWRWSASPEPKKSNEMDGKVDLSGKSEKKKTPKKDSSKDRQSNERELSRTQSRRRSRSSSKDTLKRHRHKKESKKRKKRSRSKSTSSDRETRRSSSKPKKHRRR